MNGFTTGINFTTCPYFDGETLMGLKRDERGNITKYKMDGNTLIPDTDIMQKPKIDYTQYLPNQSIIKQATQSNIAHLNVSELSQEIESLLREYLIIPDEEYPIVVNYILSTWTPDCFSTIPHLLFTCPNSPGNAQLILDLMSGFVPTLDGDTRPKRMMNGADFGMTLMGSLHFAEKWEQKILIGGRKKGKPISVRNTRAEVFSPRILTRTRYYRFSYSYEISVLRANADSFYSDLTVNRKIKDMRIKLGFYRLKHAIELKNRSARPLSDIDMLGTFSGLDKKKVEKFKFILLPALLFNSSYQTPIKKYIATETPIDDRIDKLVLESALNIVKTNNPTGKGWYVDRNLIVDDIQEDLARIGFDFAFDGELDKMIGVVLFSLRMVPAKRTPGGWTHWCNKKLIEKHLAYLKD